MGNAIKTIRQGIAQQLDERWAYAQKLAATDPDATFMRMKEDHMGNLN